MWEQGLSLTPTETLLLSGRLATILERLSSMSVQSLRRPLVSHGQATSAYPPTFLFILFYDTGWSIVCQTRANVPAPMAAILWFGIDDSSTSVHFPIYGSATRIPAGWAGKGPQDGVTPPLMTFSLDSAFYVFNLVANWAYSRWDAIYPDVYQVGEHQ